MRTIYQPVSDQIWSEYFLSQAKQSGHGLSSYNGLMYQRGNGIGSLFRGLFRLIVPLAKNTLIPAAKRAGKAIGTELLSGGMNAAGGILAGEPIGRVVKKQARSVAGNLLKRAGQKVQAGGSKPRKRGRPKGRSSSRTVIVKKRRTHERFDDIFK